MRNKTTIQSAMKWATMLMVALSLSLFLLTISGCGSDKETADIEIAGVIDEILVEERIETRLDPVPASVKSEADPTLPVGQTYVRTAGKDGVKEVTYRITFEDGMEVDRETISEIMITRPVSRVIAVGTYVPATSQSSQSSQPQQSANGIDCDPEFEECIPGLLENSGPVDSSGLYE